MYLEKKNVTPQQAVKILEKNGIKTNEKEAKKILDFLYILAILVVREYLEED
ncbi:hypothetical protein SAMN04489864_108222 [Pedobacter insulae]|uniref:Uncharacterized protein n=1 Tax=Pedobacter insulae TaxID=414048 RepID=A0A1I2Z0E9_9SPHI|nr:hypothetical protein SAMN04489864_108222 [Pedobacter insulae]